MTKKHESSWKVNVGMVKKSQATIASRWLARKADQQVAGSPRRGTRRRYAAFGDVEAELQEFPMDPGRAPGRILRRQATDHDPNLLADSRPAPALSGSPARVEAKAVSMPPDDTLRFHDEQHV
jgi:hypothetical protein